jgi:hypothetical protein
MACLLCLLALGGCGTSKSRQPRREGDPELKLRLAEVLRVPASRLEYRGPWGVYEEWTIAAPTPGGERATIAVSEDKPALYYSYPTSGEILSPPVEWFRPDALMDDNQALRLARLNATRLWLCGVPNSSVRTVIAKHGAEYVTVKVTISGGTPPYPADAAICLNRRSGGVACIETGKWVVPPDARQ